MSKYVNILEEELLTALGCTEPIAISLLAARFSEALEESPEHIKIKCSGNIIKNVKSVVVPNTGGLKGIEVAVLAGVISKNWQAGLEVLNDFSNSDRKKLAELLQKNIVEVKHLKSPAILHIIIEGASKNNTAYAELIHAHTNIVKVLKNDKIIFEKPFNLKEEKTTGVDRSCLNVKEILNFARTVDIKTVAPLLKNQINVNMKIAEAGLKELPEKSITKIILKNASKIEGKDLSPITKAKLNLAAAIEARMSGMSYPVVSNSGSGNQGLCVSIPVVVFGRDKKLSEEKILRALIVSNLVSNHQKTGIGKLSAYCGAISATTAAMAGIAFMMDCNYDVISNTISNSLATISGMVCDGAKSSCVTKALIALNSAYLSYFLATDDLAFQSGDGIVKNNVEETIKAVGVLARQGMQATDQVLLKIMIDEKNE